MLVFNVRGQRLSRIDSFEPAEKSVGYLQTEFHFVTDEWKRADKVTLRAKNQADSVVYECNVKAGLATVPWEALKTSGVVCLSLFGEVEGAEVTTNIVQVDIRKTLDSGLSTNPPTPTEFDLLQQEVKDLKEQVENIVPGGGGGIIIDSDGEGNVAIRATSSGVITSDGAGNVSIG